MFCEITRFFNKQHPAENGKNSRKSSATPKLRLNFCFLKSIRFVDQCYHPKINTAYDKNGQKSQCACFNEIVGSNKMKMKTKNSSPRYVRLWPRHVQKYTNNVKSVSVCCLRILKT